MPQRPKSMGRNILLPAALLVVGSVSMGVAAQAPAPITLPLDVEGGGGRPLITVSIGGTELEFILDSGAPSGLIVESVAAAAGARRLGATTINSPLGGEGLAAERVSVGSLAVGPLDLGATEFYSIADDAFPLPGGAAGVLPLARLAQDHVVILDLAAGAVQLTPSAPAGVTWSALDRGDGQMTAMLSVGGTEIPTHIDTGSPGGVMLPLHYAETLGVADSLEVIGRMRTIDAERDIHSVAYVEPIRLGGAELALENLRFADLPAGNLGGAALVGHVFILDRGAQRFALARSGARNAATPTGGARRVVSNAGGEPPRLGLRAAPGADAIQVMGTDPGSRAERAGLLAGDRVVAINGVAIAQIPQAELRERFGAMPLVLTVERDGENIEIEVP